MAISAIAAGGALLGGLSSAYGTLTRGNQQQQTKYDYSLANLDAAQNNELYQRALSALINTRSVAGTQDSFGSSVQYDPATNTWRTVLGPLPEAAQRASDLAGISRNTTDVRNAQFANEQAALRAAQAGPAADTAIRNLQSYRPMGSDELAGLLTAQATNASNATFRPLVADTLRSFQRSGTAAGPVLADIGRTQYNALRDSLMKSRTDAITGVDAINQGRRQGLEQSAANAYTLSTPQFQYPGLNTATGSNTLANLVAQRAQQAGTAPAYGAAGVNTAANQRQTAGQGVIGNVPGQLNTAADVGKDIGSMLSNKDLVNNLGNLFDSGDSGSVDAWQRELTNSPQSRYYDPTGTATFGSKE
jgi:hypothetical protein